MKHSFTLEPGLRYAISEKRAKRESFKKHRKIYNRIFRRKLKENPEMDTTILKKRVDWEY